MSNRLEITTVYKNSYWSVKAKVKDDSEEDFPREIFLWTVALDGSLEEFKAIGHEDQLAKYPLYDSNRTSNFGIRLVRADYSEQRLHSEEDVVKVITVLKSAFDILTKGFELANEPVVEYYP